MRHAGACNARCPVTICTSYAYAHPQQRGPHMKRTSFSLRTLVSIQSSVLIGIVVAACGSNDQMPPVNSNGMALKPCNGDGDCSVPTPYCYSNYCVECLSNNNCFG